MFQARLVLFLIIQRNQVLNFFFWLGFGYLINAFDEYRLHGKQVLAFWAE